MSKSDKGFIVPIEDRAEYEKLVKRANYRITKGYEYIQNEKGITDKLTQQSIIGDYAHDQSTAPFSRSTKFNSKAEYERYVRHVSKWGRELHKNVKDPIKHVTENIIKSKRRGYIQNITESLNTLAFENGIPLDNGKLPGGIYEKVKNLTTEQLRHFFDNDPAEMIESARWSSEAYEGADLQQFIDVTIGHLNALKETHKRPKRNNLVKRKKPKRKKKKRKTTKRKKKK